MSNSILPYYLVLNTKCAMLAIKMQCQDSVFMQAEYKAIYIKVSPVFYLDIQDYSSCPWLYMKPYTPKY